MQIVSEIDAPAQIGSSRNSPQRRIGRLTQILDSEPARLAGLVTLYSFLAVLFLRAFYVADPDIWWHLRTGDWILAHRAVPGTDPFSAYGMGKPWVEYSWLFDVLTALAFARLGFISIALYEIAVRLVLSVALFHLLRGLLGGFWRAAGLTAVALYAMTVIIGPRPGMLSILFVILTFDILLSARRTGHGGSLWLLPPIFVLWANWHIQFVDGLFVLGVFACEPLLDALSRYSGLPAAARAAENRGNMLPVKQVWLAFASSALATLLNPYGARLYSTVLFYVRQTGTYDAISELKAMTFRQPQHFVVLLLALAAALAMGWRRDVKPLWLVFLAAASMMAFRSVREVWFLAVVAACVIAEGWDQKPAAFLPGASAALSARMRVAVVVCVLAVLAVCYSRYGISNDSLAINVAGEFPEEASWFVEHHHLPGPLLNDLSWGGFLIWRLPQLPVAIDGRNNIHGQDRIQQFSDLWTGKPGWDSNPDLIRANTVITPRVSAIAALLRTDPRFLVAFEDAQSVVFERR